MKCTAPGRNIKVFGKAIQCLAKVGEDIYFEGEASGLAVRTVNLSRSAYGSFLFQTSFFSKFSLQSPNSGELRCKVSSRSCLSIFKNLISLEKSVDNFSLELKFREGELVFILIHKYGIKKQFNLTFQECEGLSAIFNKNSSVIHIISNHKFLGECVVHFPSSVGEITLSAKHDHAFLSNYVEEESQYGKVLQTQMRLANSEFSCYDVSVDREITFCLKEWRAVLGFQDAVAQPLHLFFDDPGRPIIMTIDGDGMYECDFVLATLTDQNSSSQITQSTSTSRVVDNTTRVVDNTTKGTTQRQGARKVPPPQAPSRSVNGTRPPPLNETTEQEEEENPFSKSRHVTTPRHVATATSHVATPSHVARPPQASLILSPDPPQNPRNSLSLSPLPPSPAQKDNTSPLPLSPFSPDNMEDSVIDDALLASLRGPPDGPDFPPVLPTCTPDGPGSPPNKRFKRLSSEEEDEPSVINPTNNIMYCDDSD